MIYDRRKREVADGRLLQFCVAVVAILACLVSLRCVVLLCRTRKGGDSA